MGDIAVRRFGTRLIVLMAALLLLVAGANIGRATLAAATSGQNGPVPSVIDAGTSSHLTVTVESAPAPAQTKHSDEHDSGDGGDD